MLFGTAAAVAVALATVPVGRWLTGTTDAARAYLGAAMLFALGATAPPLSEAFAAGTPSRPSATAARLARRVRRRRTVTIASG
jgi:GPH family glycoside/pentoside/hexuronide:cation symporter